MTCGECRLFEPVTGYITRGEGFCGFKAPHSITQEFARRPEAIYRATDACTLGEIFFRVAPEPSGPRGRRLHVDD